MQHFYRFYGKEYPGDRFKPIDLQLGKFVVNLIHASFVNTKEEAETILKDLIKSNSNMKFQIRRCT